MWIGNDFCHPPFDLLKIHVSMTLRKVFSNRSSVLLENAGDWRRHQSAERLGATMEPIAHLIKVSVPNYLADLPIPDSIGGWFRLGVRDWFALLPPTALLTGMGYMSYRAFCPRGRPVPSGCVNLKIKKDIAKVVDTVDIEDISEKAVFCRCWRSENWPYCDGTHGRHNNECNDNVGPLIVTSKKG